MILKVYMRKWKRERDKLQTLEMKFVVFLLYITVMIYDIILKWYNLRRGKVIMSL